MSREAEDKLEAKLKDAKEQSNQQIVNLIKECMKNGGKIYLTTDWHLILKDKDNPRSTHERSDSKAIIKKMQELNENDLLINLGDLVDGECRNKTFIKETIQSIPCKQILVLGNNDLFEPSFYKECGFKYVVQAFTYNGILFSHMPQKDHGSDMNIHGHIHGYAQYWVPFDNMIDVAYYDGRKKPIRLESIIQKKDTYAKVAKEVPKHFDEYSIFEDLFGVEDPFED